MIDNLGGVTSQLVSAAVDAAIKRHQVHAHNIANSETPGFVSSRLEFESQLKALWAQLNQVDNPRSANTHLAKFRDEVAGTSMIKPSDRETVQLDQELAAISQNVLYYHALLDAAGKRSAIIKMAINGGRN